MMLFGFFRDRVIDWKDRTRPVDLNALCTVGFPSVAGCLPYLCLFRESHWSNLVFRALLQVRHNDFSVAKSL
jgi:hypothetical protein